MYHAYRATEDQEILTADPLELVRLLYGGALSAIAEAREALAQGDILRRGSRITKASAIVSELAASLNHGDQSGISHKLAELYHYVLMALADAHRLQSDEKLVSAEKVLQTLQEAWREVRVETKSAPVPAYGEGVRIPEVYA